jgi:hypothetical protein
MQSPLVRYGLPVKPLKQHSQLQFQCSSAAALHRQAAVM